MMTKPDEDPSEDPIEDLHEAPSTERDRAALLEQFEFPSEGILFLTEALKEVPEFWRVLWTQGRLRDMAEDPKDAILELDPNALRKTRDTLHPDSRLAQTFRRRIKWIETHMAFLEEYGFTYNFKDCEVKFSVPEGKKAPPTLLFTEVVRALQKELLQQNPGLEPKDIRLRISPLIAPVFGAEAADSKAKGRLDQACYRTWQG